MPLLIPLFFSRMGRFVGGKMGLTEGGWIDGVEHV
jgi:hypothetical protein